MGNTLQHHLQQPTITGNAIPLPIITSYTYVPAFIVIVGVGFDFYSTISISQRKKNFFRLCHYSLPLLRLGDSDAGALIDDRFQGNCVNCAIAGKFHADRWSYCDTHGMRTITGRGCPNAPPNWFFRLCHALSLSKGRGSCDPLRDALCLDRKTLDLVPSLHHFRRNEHVGWAAATPEEYHEGLGGIVSDRWELAQQLGLVIRMQILDLFHGTALYENVRVAYSISHNDSP
jgi:hypothetical protein